MDYRMNWAEIQSKGEAKTLAEFQELAQNSTVQSEKSLAVILEAVQAMFN